MNLPTKHQLIEHEGRPVAVVVPYNDYLELTNSKERDPFAIPQEVMELKVIENLTSIAAWRKYRGYTQQQMAEKLGVTQSAYSQLESRQFFKARKETQEKILSILETHKEQMLDFT